MPLDRRDFLRAALIGVGAASPLGQLACAGGSAAPREAAPARGPFRHGVASGDPLADRVILWTRVTPGSDGPAAGSWLVARDPGLRDVVRRGAFATDAGRDFTVKVDAAGLEPGRSYYYAFETGGDASPVGRTRTLPTGPTERLRLAAFSCANLPAGYFNAYALAARRADLDLVLHLGDYLYEYANGTYGDGAALGRIPEPDREIVSLGDYRARHAQYKRDPDLQALHRQHPMIAVWDDHEIANDAWTGGAKNHQPETEGDWATRRAAAVRAYLEWMPVRETPAIAGGCLQRSFRLGDLAELVMLDTRLCGRDRQASGPGDAATLADRRRTLLGREQERWLGAELLAGRRARVRWTLLGQQILLGHVTTPDGRVRIVDEWDGYPFARERLLAFLETRGIERTLVLSGDVHSSWAIDVPRERLGPKAYDPATGRGAIAAEMVTPAVSSPGVEDPREAERLAADFLARHPAIRWCELHRQGYLVLDVDADRAQGDWFHVKTVREASLEEEHARSFALRGDRRGLVPVDAPSPARPDPPPLAT